MKSFRIFFFVFLAFCGFSFFYFAPNIFSGKLFCYRDIGRYYYPTRFFVVESLIKGDFPLWNPYIFCGYPAFASLQQATLYPLSLLYLLFPFFSGFNFYFIIHNIVASVGMYLLLKKYCLSFPSAFAGAVCFSFCGYTLSMMNLLTTLSAIVWLPWIFLFFIQFKQRQEIMPLLGCSVIFVLQLFSGQPEIAFITGLMFSFFLFSIRALTIRQKLYSLGFSFLVFIALSSIQLFPFFELLKNSVRLLQQNTPKNVWSFHPLEMINFILPSWTDRLVAGSPIWFGQAWMKTGYTGVIALILSGLGISSGQREKNFFLMMGLISLFLSFGEFVPGARLLHEYLPGFSSIRYPIKYICLFYFSLAVFSGFGAEKLLSQRISLKKMFWPLMLFMCLLIVLLFGLEFNLFLPWLEKTYLHKLAFLEKKLFYYHFSKLSHDVIVNIFLVGGFFCLLLFRSLLKKKIFPFFFLFFVLVSSLYGTYRLEPLVEREFYTIPTENTQFLKTNVREERYFLSPKSSAEAIKGVPILPDVDFKEDFYKRQKVVLPNLGVVHHLATIDGYESIKLKNNEHVKNMLSARPLAKTAKFIDVLGVKYILSFYPIEEKQFNLVRDDYIFFYENLNAGKRVYLFDKVLFLEDEKQIDQVLDGSKFNPFQEVIIHEGADDTISLPSGSALRKVNMVEFIENSPRQIVIEAETSDLNWLVLADTYYPGWRASVNNAPTKIYRANYMMRAVVLPPGKNKIVFTFRPAWFWPSLVITLSVCQLLLMAVYFRLRGEGV